LKAQKREEHELEAQKREEHELDLHTESKCEADHGVQGCKGKSEAEHDIALGQTVIVDGKLGVIEGTKAKNGMTIYLVCYHGLSRAHMEWKARHQMRVMI
jgi:hypothetical protein